MSAAAETITRTVKPWLRSTAIVLATLFAIGAPVAQALFPFGLSASAFANDGNETLRAAGYAFSIWSVIYLGLAVYAIYQASPSTLNTPALNALGWPSVIAIAGCGAWILAAAFDQKFLSVVIIAASAATLTVALIGSARLAERRERWFVLWPLALLAGWLTIASAINAVTVLTALDVINEDTAAVAGVSGIVLVTLAALTVTTQSRLVAYALAIAWGLVGVYVAEHDHRPMAALVAAAAAVVVLGFALWRGAIQRRDRAKPET